MIALLLTAALLAAPASPAQPCKAIAHRAGASATTDENSLEAITRSASFGAWSEVDVRVLADGKLVLFHDDNWRTATPGKVTKAEARQTERGETHRHLVRRVGPNVTELYHRDGWTDFASDQNWLALRVKWDGHRLDRAWLITCNPYVGPDTDWTCEKERVA